MLISRKSWHYRLFRYCQNIGDGPAYLNPFTNRGRRDVELPSSLCPYVWSIVLALIGTLFLALFLVAVSPIWITIWLVVLLVRLVIRGVAYASSKMPRRDKREPREREERPERVRRPSLAGEFIRARKEKVCPTIKLVD